MCFCDPNIRTPYCDSFICQNELKRISNKDDKISLLSIKNKSNKLKNEFKRLKDKNKVLKDCVKFYATTIEISDVEYEGNELISYTKVKTYDNGEKAREVLEKLKDM
jgi:hypothetical protein